MHPPPRARTRTASRSIVRSQSQRDWQLESASSRSRPHVLIPPARTCAPEGSVGGDQHQGVRAYFEFAHQLRVPSRIEPQAPDARPRATFTPRPLAQRGGNAVKLSQKRIAAARPDPAALPSSSVRRLLSASGPAAQSPLSAVLQAQIRALRLRSSSSSLPLFVPLWPSFLPALVLAPPVPVPPA